jgi:hypothetical protein
VRPYVDTLAALVPAEVLAVQAFILTFTTKTVTVAGVETTSITDARVLETVWWALVILSAALYAIGHFRKFWDRWDWVRMLIPAAAFAIWTMGQPSSSFDAVADWSTAARYATVAIGAVVLAAIAAALGGKADEKAAADGGDAQRTVPARGRADE